MTRRRSSLALTACVALLTISCAQVLGTDDYAFDDEGTTSGVTTTGGSTGSGTGTMCGQPTVYMPGDALSLESDVSANFESAPVHELAAICLRDTASVNLCQGLATFLLTDAEPQVFGGRGILAPGPTKELVIDAPSAPVVHITVEVTLADFADLRIATPGAVSLLVSGQGFVDLSTNASDITIDTEGLVTARGLDGAPLSASVSVYERSPQANVIVTTTPVILATPPPIPGCAAFFGN